MRCRGVYSRVYSRFIYSKLYSRSLDLPADRMVRRHIWHLRWVTGMPVDDSHTPGCLLVVSMSEPMPREAIECTFRHSKPPMTTVYSCIALQPSLQPVDPSTADTHCDTPAVYLYSYTALYSLQLYSSIQSTALYTPPQDTCPSGFAVYLTPPDAPSAKSASQAAYRQPAGLRL